MDERVIPEDQEEISSEYISPDDLKNLLEFKKYKISPDELRMLMYRCTDTPIPINFSEMKYYEKLMIGLEDEQACVVDNFFDDNKARIRVDIGWGHLIFEVKNGILFLVYETPSPKSKGNFYLYEIGKPTANAVLEIIKLYKTKGQGGFYSDLTLPELLDNRKRLANTKSANTIQ